MEKVMVTKKQAQQLSQLKTVAIGNAEDFVKHKANGDKFNDVYEDLNEMTLDDFIKALYIGYEVEPEFKVGDWVFDKWAGRAYEVKEIEGSQVVVDSSTADKHNIGFAWIRHATAEEIMIEKERMKWAEHGRVVNGFKKGDVIYYEDYYTVVAEVFTDGRIKDVDGDFTDIEEAKLVCPVEKRFDFGEFV